MKKVNRIAKPMLVNLPTEGYESTGEGGLAFFFLIPTKPFEERRQVCIAGEIIWPRQDVCFRHDYCAPEDGMTIDGGLLIGSTNQSLYSKFRDEYFQPTYKDLTIEGKKLHRILVELYGEVDIVTLLDT